MAGTFAAAGRARGETAETGHADIAPSGPKDRHSGSLYH